MPHEACPECESSFIGEDQIGDDVYETFDCGSMLRRGELKQTHECVIAALRLELAAVTKERDDLLAFKVYTHKRLTEIGAPEEVPDSPHTAAGCRVGGRFDWLRERLDCFEATCGEVLDTLINWDRDDGEAGEALRFAIQNMHTEKFNA